MLESTARRRYSGGRRRRYHDRSPSQSIGAGASGDVLHASRGRRGGVRTLPACVPHPAGGRRRLPCAPQRGRRAHRGFLRSPRRAPDRPHREKAPRRVSAGDVRVLHRHLRMQPRLRVLPEPSPFAPGRRAPAGAGVRRARGWPAPQGSARFSSATASSAPPREPRCIR